MSGKTQSLTRLSSYPVGSKNKTGSLYTHYALDRSGASRRGAESFQNAHDGYVKPIFNNLIKRDNLITALGGCGEYSLSNSPKTRERVECNAF